MALIESELGKALNPAVKRKGNSTRKLRSAAKRVTGGGIRGHGENHGLW